MAKKKAKKACADMTREERVTGKPPLEETLDPTSREYHVKYGWPKEKANG